MCNLYSINRSQEAMRRLFAITLDTTGNLPPMPGVFPDMPAPIVRIADGEARANFGALGHARAAAIWGVAGHEHPQHEQPALV